ncbi:MAG TPA: DUF4129 domain-containing protein, partial [Fimbriimonadaceae bacterium]|nr:DUF4129 domain-containing protein [Fimbriimonadaceae bacterium]
MTLKHWPQMSGVRIAKLVSSCSLFITVALCAASDIREFDSALKSAKAAKQVYNVSLRFKDVVNSDPILSKMLIDLRTPEAVVRFKKAVALRAAVAPQKAGGFEAIRSIKSSPLYRDPGVQEESNWLDGAMRRLLGLLRRPKPPSIGHVPTLGVPGWIIPTMWFILGGAVLFLLFLMLRHISWKRGLKRKATAMLEDDEPERTLDEWLANADEHFRAGRYREAVRAMYLSCLLKFDEAGVARFIRGETNWEHLSRISSSIKKPDSVDFRPPTQAFDRIWYGHHVRGPEDVEQFRAWYQQITEAL